ncbi:MAG: hypothetical protein QOK48_1611 [Blastocatellia bacterium]|jgi:hypothetical protein|nr:hypothetical protein [Blastocatellia bacterium]
MYLTGPDLVNEISSSFTTLLALLVVLSFTNIYYSATVDPSDVRNP